MLFLITRYILLYNTLHDVIQPNIRSHDVPSSESNLYHKTVYPTTNRWTLSPNGARRPYLIAFMLGFSCVCSTSVSSGSRRRPNVTDFFFVISKLGGSGGEEREDKEEDRSRMWSLTSDKSRSRENRPSLSGPLEADVRRLESWWRIYS